MAFITVQRETNKKEVHKYAFKPARKMSTRFLACDICARMLKMIRSFLFAAFIHIKHFMGEGKRSRQFKIIFSFFSADLTILWAFMTHFSCYPCIICVSIAALSQVHTQRRTYYILHFEIRTHNFLHIFIPLYLCLYLRVHMHLCMNNTLSFQILILNSEHSRRKGKWKSLSKHSLWNWKRLHYYLTFNSVYIRFFICWRPSTQLVTTTNEICPYVFFLKKSI